MRTPSKKQTVNVAAVILSGGQGERMQGQDKGLIPYRGQPMLEWTLQVVEPLVGEVLISCNRNYSTYEQFKVPLVMDSSVGFIGPLGGIQAAMDKVGSQYSHLLVLPCDTPNICSEALQLLLAVSNDEPDKIVFLSTKGRPQFLHAIVPMVFKSALSNWLSEGQRAVYRWYKTCDVVQVDADKYADSLLNVNCLAQVEAQVS